MISFEELIKYHESFYFEVEKNEREEFLHYCVGWGLSWENKKIEPQNDIHLVKENILYCGKNKIKKACNLLDDVQLNEIWHYRFEDIRNNRILPIIDGIAFMEKFDIPQNDEDTYLPYGLKAIVLPVLNNPGDINKLYKGINKDKEWHSPDVYYKGSYAQTTELNRRFGTKELNSSKNHVCVIASGKDIRDNQAYILNKDDNLYSNIRRWIPDNNGIPRLLEYEDIMDSILIPGRIDPRMIRCINPNSIINEHVYTDNESTDNEKHEEYTQVFIHYQLFEYELLALLDKLKIDRYIKIIKTVSYDKEMAYEFTIGKHPTINSFKNITYYKTFDEEKLNDGSLELYIKDRHRVSHFLLMALAMYKQQNKWLSEIKSK